MNPKQREITGPVVSFLSLSYLKIGVFQQGVNKQGAEKILPYPEIFQN